MLAGWNHITFLSLTLPSSNNLANNEVFFGRRARENAINRSENYSRQRTFSAIWISIFYSFHNSGSNSRTWLPCESNFAGRSHSLISRWSSSVRGIRQINWSARLVCFRNFSTNFQAEQQQQRRRPMVIDFIRPVRADSPRQTTDDKKCDENWVFMCCVLMISK